MQNESYAQERNKNFTRKTREILKELPPFCGAFFRAIENNTAVLTRFAYATDLRTFFQFLVLNDELFPGRAIPSITVAELERVKRYHIELFLADVSLYYKDEQEFTNNERAKARKLSTLRAFFKYLFKRELLSANVASLVDAPKLHDKPIIRLEPNEIADLLDRAEHGDGLSERQMHYHQISRTRDVAILTLFLGTGIRISELVGLDINDVDFESSSFVVTRKGGAQDILTFGNEVYRALFDYVDLRKQQIPVDGHEDALFLSLQMKRISVRSVEYLVKKYASIAVPLKKISPHKLRSTFGTMLYHESQDIYLVADVLGHKDVNTTRKHYAAASEENKRKAARMIRLRDD